MEIDPRLASAVGGTLGGVLGTAFMQTGMKLAPRLPEAARPPEPVYDPGDFMVRQAELLVGRALPDGVHETAAQGMHWAYGTTWGLALGLAAPVAGVKSWGEALVAGAAMGALCWAAGWVGWLPAARLTEPVHRQGATHALSALSSHVLYGVLAALPMYGLMRALAPRRRWYARWL